MLFWLFPNKVIKAEYRTIISNKKVIGASGYPHNFKNLEDYNSIVPEAVISLAESAAKDIDISDKIYILDVAETDLGYKVIELNCLATSGWYNIEAKDIAPHLDWHLKNIQKELYS
jgi:glutathione synthase/RimK-type ligase-like ATP-grasp enzyme